MRRLRVYEGTRLARARNARGKRGEERAEALLAAAGYRVVARQLRTSYRILADARDVQVGLTHDFVVSRDGRELVAEVKTGTLVSQLRHADTRRQLLEYQLASGAPSVLLVDPDAERITEVSFPLGAPAAGAAPEPQPDTGRSDAGKFARACAWLIVCGILLWFICARLRAA